MAANRPTTGIGFIGVAAAIAIWTFCLYLQRRLPLPQMHLSPGWRWGVSLLFFADGLGTFIWSAITLVKANREKRLASSGPYALVRHPMYGTVLWSGTAAVAFFFQSWLVLLGVLPLHLVWIWLVQKEEQELLQRFGDTYLEYIEVTGQFLPRMASLKKVAQDPSDTDG
ncbi:MAG: isoprenylcysteine carboxylmethyltransferase family protein [Fidelibacterota bacterium]|nr:MAG: isoprenylcysteine carboxylmethyltransferase family protein [Candidatus Neomarinimicrobiota bacterium]